MVSDINDIAENFRREERNGNNNWVDFEIKSPDPKCIYAYQTRSPIEAVGKTTRMPVPTLPNIVVSNAGEIILFSIIVTDEEGNVTVSSEIDLGAVPTTKAKHEPKHEPKIEEADKADKTKKVEG